MCNDENIIKNGFKWDDLIARLGKENPAFDITRYKPMSEDNTIMNNLEDCFSKMLFYLNMSRLMEYLKKRFW